MFEPHLDRFVEIQVSPQYDGNNRLTGILHIVRDITKHKNTEQKLKAVVSKLQAERTKSDAIIEALGDGIIIQDTQYRIVYQNEMQIKQYGDQTGNYCYKVYEGRDTVCEDCPVEKTFRDGGIYRSERRIPVEKGNMYVELISSPLKNSRGKIIAGLKLVRDITDRRNTEEELKRNRTELMELVEDRTSELTASNELLRQEIMDRRYAEHNLMQSERKYRNLYDNAPGMYHSINREMRGQYLGVKTGVQSRKVLFQGI